MKFQNTFSAVDGLIKIDPSEIHDIKMFIKHFSHPFTRKILRFLADHGKLNVTELYIKLRCEQAILSQQLTILRDRNIVSKERKGKFNYYEVNLLGIEEIISFCKTISGEVSQEAAIKKAYEICRALSNDRRIEILQFIDYKGVSIVSDIYRGLGLLQAACSHDLKILRDAGIVHTVRRGSFIDYFVNYYFLAQIVSCVRQLNKKEFSY